jgi:exosortase A-associated hydrolase 1
MNPHEEPLVFECAGEALVGILSLPATHVRTAVVIVVGGPQYRAGSHRQFTLLARALADAGIPAMRFDHRGIGDSAGRQRPFDSIDADIGSAIDALVERLPSLERLVLFGLCDGASAALLYWHGIRDARVRGLCLVNPWVRDETSQARTTVKHYYARRLLEREFWAKLFRGQLGTAAIGELLHHIARMRVRRANHDARTFQARMASAWREFDGSLLLLLSGNDYTAKEFLEQTRGDARWAGALRHLRLERHDIEEADHTFSHLACREKMHALTLDWIERTFGAPAPESRAVQPMTFAESS